LYSPQVFFYHYILYASLINNDSYKNKGKLNDNALAGVYR
jgi:hypothetical protein